MLSSPFYRANLLTIRIESPTKHRQATQRLFILSGVLVALAIKLK